MLAVEHLERRAFHLDQLLEQTRTLARCDALHAKEQLDPVSVEAEIHHAAEACGNEPTPLKPSEEQERLLVLGPNMEDVLGLCRRCLLCRLALLRHKAKAVEIVVDALVLFVLVVLVATSLIEPARGL